MRTIAEIDIKKVKKMCKDGMTHEQIAKELGTTKNYINKILYEDRQKAAGNPNYLPAPKKRGRPPGSKNKRTMAERMVANYPNSPLMSSALSEANAGRAQAAVGHVMQCMQYGSNVNPDSIQSLYKGLEEYIKFCFENDFPPTVATCCLALGIDHRTLSSWRKGLKRGSDPEYKKFAESVKYVIQAGIEACMVTGLINPVVGIWWEKAHFDMIETQKVVTEQADPLGESKSAKEIVEKYADILPEE